MLCDVDSSVFNRSRNLWISASSGSFWDCGGAAAVGGAGFCVGCSVSWICDGAVGCDDSGEDDVQSHPIVTVNLDIGVSGRRRRCF